MRPLSALKCLTRCRHIGKRSGKVFCAHCGRSLHRQRAERKKGPDVYWFHCLTKSRVDRDGCIGVAMQESELMATVTSILEKEPPSGPGTV
ncbi:zinc ribbon domain-containing protein [[Clostridium] hylemonae]|uniref:zinc ribbon domain-containing protein n=1 Tax=[Clostridium] hylemonae TaxID=89153 RepID=UPI001FCC8FC2|nr:zinc ribbon domain-containing protein [[Clostridium] hylemonae]